MKTFRLLGAALFAVLAVGAVSVASASAAVSFLAAEWLKNGNPVTAKETSEASGELLLEDLKGGPLGEPVAVLCTGGLIGTAGPGGEDSITEALNAAKESISTTPLSGLALECALETGPCESPLVWAVNLPWNTLAELMVDGTEEFFVDLLLNGGKGNPAWEVECMAPIVASDTCTAASEGIAHLTNLTEDVGAEFAEAFTELAEIKLATCERSTGSKEENVGVVESDAQGLISLIGGGTLQIFS